MIATIHLDI